MMVVGRRMKAARQEAAVRPAHLASVVHLAWAVLPAAAERQVPRSLVLRIQRRGQMEQGTRSLVAMPPGNLVSLLLHVDAFVRIAASLH